MRLTGIDLNLQSLVTSRHFIKIQQTLDQNDRLEQYINCVYEDLENSVIKNSDFGETKRFLSQ